ncbi:hypothetical protein [Brevibacterium sp. FME17]|uniref:hypothetical protein n=1 Tax=Brevibacterium sp. FME17 TaxID=2742606 RepID=UPI001866AA95|nr:hypothetical protein [Brevibacterium sp. FME17]
MNHITARIGAIFYVIWGLVHIAAAYQLLQLGQSLDPGMVQARIFQDSWNILMGALASVAVGATMNWRNSWTGYWINLILVTTLDVAYIAFVVVPGYAPLWPGLAGPILWVLAAIASTVGIVGARRGASAASTLPIR